MEITGLYGDPIHLVWVPNVTSLHKIFATRTLLHRTGEGVGIIRVHAKRAYRRNEG
jgi:hypothetical protein